MGAPRGSVAGPKLAYFISSHGFGHGARSCAIIDALDRLDPSLDIEIWSALPDWFFADSLRRPLTVHDEVTDLGLVQSNALEEDLPATLRQLRQWVPSPPPRVGGLVKAIRERRITHLVADISPLGLDVAAAAGIPSALVENFTWDWIYRGYLEAEPAFGPIADQLERSFATASLRLQVEPFCHRQQHALHCSPVSRRPRSSRPDTRRRLGIPEGAPMILVTMGGIEWDFSDLESRLNALSADHWLVIPGSCAEPQRQGRVVRLPHRSDFYHPDLIHAADAVLGKLGYSTLAEVWSAGLPFAYIPRGRFPESPPLEAWVQRRMAALRIDPQRFVDGRWLEDLGQLLDCPPSSKPRTGIDGADEVAHHLLRWLSGRSPGASLRDPASGSTAPAVD